MKEKNGRKRDMYALLTIRDNQTSFNFGEKETEIEHKKFSLGSVLVGKKFEKIH